MEKALLVAEAAMGRSKQKMIKDYGWIFNAILFFVVGIFMLKDIENDYKFGYKAIGMFLGGAVCILMSTV